MTFATTTLRPGWLVSLKTSVTGNVSHNRTVIEPEHDTPQGRKSKVEVERTVIDPKEQEEAVKVRGRASGLIRSVCTRTEGFGLLCPEVLAGELDKAVVEARQIADQFNRTAKLTTVELFIIKGKIAQDDVEAARAINSELRDLLADMKTGLETLNVKAVREAASRAKNVGRMLNPAAAERISNVVDTVRAEAKKIVKAGEAAALDIDQAVLDRISNARTAFLDLDPITPEVTGPLAEARALDLSPVELTPAQKAAAARKRRAAAELELDGGNNAL